MFIRIKKRKNLSGKTNTYAYLVKSKRRKRSRRPPKQKVIAYLGKVIRLNNNHQQSSTIINNQIKHSSIRKMVTGHITRLLSKNGFEKAKKGLLSNKDIIIDLKSCKVRHKKTNKKLCLQVNEGFISDYTLKQVLNYTPVKGLEKEVGKDLANKLLSVGLRPTEEEFLEIYSHIAKGFQRK
jgi:UDP-galactopyranose mutase